MASPRSRFHKLQVLYPNMFYSEHSYKYNSVSVINNFLMFNFAKFILPKALL